MDTIKGFINALVLIMKLLIWTILVLYGLAGLYLLINGNPDKGTPQYESIHDKAWEFAVYAFFITIILVPGSLILAVIMLDSNAINYDFVAPAIAWYVILLALGCIVGVINHLIAD
jgi:hypothetical protein